MKTSGIHEREARSRSCGTKCALQHASLGRGERSGAIPHPLQENMRCSVFVRAECVEDQTRETGHTCDAPQRLTSASSTHLLVGAAQPAAEERALAEAGGHVRLERAEEGDVGVLLVLLAVGARPLPVAVRVAGTGPIRTYRRHQVVAGELLERERRRVVH